uniref:Uncharacterized protein n=1 Tax=Arundo donax TaxID=35708 RepID=A0A0A8XU53_ARUDO
MKLVLTQT